MVAGSYGNATSAISIKGNLMAYKPRRFTPERYKPEPAPGLIDPFKLMAQQLGASEIRETRLSDPYEFIFKYAFTLDPHDSASPIKHFPDHPYVRYLIKEWLENHSLIVVKSRQMMASWLFVALNLWLAMTQSGQYIFFISKKEDDAGWSSQLSLLSRALFIHEHLPKEVQSAYKRSTQPAILNFTKKNSSIHGVSQDSDAIRQYTSSSILADEMAFQERSEQVFASLKPTLDGRKTQLKVGKDSIIVLPKMVGVSTPNGKRNLFYKLVHDVNE